MSLYFSLSFLASFVSIFLFHLSFRNFLYCLLSLTAGFPGGSVVKNPPANAEDTDLIPGSGRFPGEGNGNLFQYSCLENPMDRRAWKATAHGVQRVKHDLVTKHAHTHTHTHTHTLTHTSLTCVYTVTI